jgi:hypothetical protein
MVQLVVVLAILLGLVLAQVLERQDWLALEMGKE